MLQPNGHGVRPPDERGTGCCPPTEGSPPCSRGDAGLLSTKDSAGST